MLGTPRRHFRQVDSTNTRARELAAAGAPHGTLVTAAEQSAGRGRQGRVWSAPPNAALLCSVLLRDPPRLLPLLAGVAVAETCDQIIGGSHPKAQIKWPNDVLLDGRKVAGILVEGRPQERWAVLGIGVNVAVAPEDFPLELRDRAGTLGRPAEEIETTLRLVLDRLKLWLTASEDAVLTAVRSRDALLGKSIAWATGEGIAAGIDGDGRLVVEIEHGRAALDAGEVHLTPRSSGDGG